MFFKFKTFSKIFTLIHYPRYYTAFCRKLQIFTTSRLVPKIFDVKQLQCVNPKTYFCDSMEEDHDLKTKYSEVFRIELK